MGRETKIQLGIVRSTEKRATDVEDANKICLPINFRIDILLSRYSNLYKNFSPIGEGHVRDTWNSTWILRNKRNRYHLIHTAWINASSNNRLNATIASILDMVSKLLLFSVMTFFCNYGVFFLHYPRYINKHFLNRHSVSYIQVIERIFRLHGVKLRKGASNINRVEHIYCWWNFDDNNNFSVPNHGINRSESLPLGPYLLRVVCFVIRY